MKPVVTAAQMKEIERLSLEHDLTYARLMENAGAAAAACVRRIFQDVQGLNCMIFCGNGNNGGDGYVAARKLRESGANILLVAVDGLPRGEEARNMHTMADIMELPILGFLEKRKKIAECLPHTDIIIDAIYGTGFHGELGPNAALACQMINEAIAAVISLDLPSGVECDSGRIAPGAVKADFTVSFDSPKPLHVLECSKEQCGTVEVVDIGIPPEAHPVFDVPWQPPAKAPAAAPPEALPQATAAPRQTQGQTPLPTAAPTQATPAPVPPPPPGPEAPVLSTEQVFSYLPPRAPDSHKGAFGTLLSVCGSSRYRGAAALSTLGALHSGVGLCCLASTETVCNAVSAGIYEAIYLPLEQNSHGSVSSMASPALLPWLKKASAVLFGCGLGQSDDTAALLDYVLARADCPVILDADGINAFSGNINRKRGSQACLILTPHPGEMARLAGVSIDEIQADRPGYALRYAKELDAVVVLKGSGTLIASPQGELLLNQTGNAGLARGGSGDVLAGMVAAFAAQGLSPFQAAACGAHLHGLAADRCAARLSQYAMQPSRMLEDLAAIFLENGR